MMNKPLSILVVDDDPSVAKSLSKVLMKAGYDIRTALSGKKALELLNESPSNIVMTDIHMPEMNGLELTGEITEKYPNTVVIAMTGYGDIDTVVKFLRSGGNDFLLKPMNLNLVKLSVESAADRFRLRQAVQRSNEALKQSEKRYRDIFENAPAGIFQTSLNGKFIQANLSTAQIFGYESPTELIAEITNIGEQLHVYPTLRTSLIDKLQHNEGWSVFEAQFYKKGGGIIVCNVTARRVQNNADDMPYFEGFIEDITEKRNREDAFKMEMARAKELYDSLLNLRLPKISGIEIHAECIPAEYIGGDVFDAVLVDEHKLLFMLADITGHGIPAAMTAGILKIIFNESTEKSIDPAIIFKYLNKTMVQILLQDDAIAIFLGLLDTQTMTIRYYMSGLPAPLILRDNEFISLKPTGFPLGVFDEPDIDTITVDLKPNDILIAFTDGITEAMSPDGDLFGAQRVKHRMKNFSGDIHTLPGIIINNVIQFQQNQHFLDDVIVLGMKLTGFLSQ